MCACVCMSVRHRHESNTIFDRHSLRWIALFTCSEEEGYRQEDGEES